MKQQVDYGDGDVRECEGELEEIVRLAFVLLRDRYGECAKLFGLIGLCQDEGFSMNIGH